MKPLFQAKPLVIVLTKIDLMKFTSLSKETQAMLEGLAKEHNAYLIQMSNETGDGIADVKQKSCDILLDYRLTQKAKDPKKAEAIVNKINITQPKKQDVVARPDCIPTSVISGLKKKGPSIKELQEEFGGAGNFSVPIEEMYTLEDEDWKYDKWPEFFNGKNVADFYDKDIEKKLAILEAEEDELLRMELEEAKMMVDESDEDGVTKDELKASLKEVRGRKTVLKIQHKLKKNLRARSKNKKLGDMEDYLESKGFDVKETGALKKRSKSRKTLMQLEGNLDAIGNSDDESDDGDSENLDDNRGRSRKRQRAQSDDDQYINAKDGVSKSKSLKNKSANKVRSLT